MKIGIAVFCLQCGRQKAPRGRSSPMGSVFCESHCSGWRKAPLPGDLWPGESEAEFGYPVSSNGTREETTQ